jgi:hypothetical protein
MMARLLAVVMLVVSSGGCALVGPHCTAQQERGTVTTLNGPVAADDVVMHRVSYDTRGSQNDARIEWLGQGDMNGPRLLVFATLASCEQFILPAEANSGNCAIVARGGWLPQGIATTLILTHGRGNPERLGTPPEYKLWITSDRATSYTIAVSYFFGPDC